MKLLIKRSCGTMYIGKKGEENQTTAAVAPPSTLGLLLGTGIVNTSRQRASWASGAPDYVHRRENGGEKNQVTATVVSPSTLGLLLMTGIVKTPMRDSFAATTWTAWGDPNIEKTGNSIQKLQLRKPSSAMQGKFSKTVPRPWQNNRTIKPQHRPWSTEDAAKFAQLRLFSAISELL